MTIDLETILKQHPDCLGNRLILKSALKDRYPQEERLIHILTVLYECGIVEQLQETTAVDSAFLGRFAGLVESKYGISPHYTQSAICLWASALGVGVGVEAEPIPNPIPTPKLTEHPDLEIPTGTVYSAEDYDQEYDLIKMDDGWYIEKFKGGEEDQITIPTELDGKEVVGIAARAFAHRTDLRKIRIGEGIKILGEQAFAYCSNLEEIEFPDSLERIEEGAFQNTALKRLRISGCVTYIGPRAFEGCDQLVSVYLFCAIKSVEVGTFAGCRNLFSVCMFSSVRRIKTAAFDQCEQLYEMEIPMGVKTIEKDAFRGSGLSKITLPASVTSIGLECSAPDWFVGAPKYQEDETLGRAKKVKTPKNSYAHRYAEARGIKTKAI